MSSGADSLSTLAGQVGIASQLPQNLALTGPESINDAIFLVEYLLARIKERRSMNRLAGHPARGAGATGPSMAAAAGTAASLSAAASDPKGSSSELQAAASLAVSGESWTAGLVAAAKWALYNKRSIRGKLQDSRHMKDARRLWRLDSSLQRLLSSCDLALRYARSTDAGDSSGGSGKPAAAAAAASHRGGSESSPPDGRARSSTQLDVDPIGMATADALGLDGAGYTLLSRGPFGSAAVSSADSKQVGFSGHTYPNRDNTLGIAIDRRRGRNRASTEIGPGTVALLQPPASAPAPTAGGHATEPSTTDPGQAIDSSSIGSGANAGAAVAASAGYDAPGPGPTSAGGPPPHIALASIRAQEAHADLPIESFSDASSEASSQARSYRAPRGSMSESISYDDMLRADQLALDESVALRVMHDDGGIGLGPDASDAGFAGMGLRASDLPPELLEDLIAATGVAAREEEEESLQRSILASLKSGGTSSDNPYYLGTLGSRHESYAALDPSSRQHRPSFDAQQIESDFQLAQGGSSAAHDRSLGDAALHAAVVHILHELRGPRRTNASMCTAAIGVSNYARMPHANHLFQVMGGIAELLSIAVKPFETAFNGAGDSSVAKGRSEAQSDLESGSAARQGLRSDAQPSSGAGADEAGPRVAATSAANRQDGMSIQHWCSHDDARLAYLAGKAALDLLATCNPIGFQVVNSVKLFLCLHMVHALSSAGPEQAASFSSQKGGLRSGGTTCTQVTDDVVDTQDMSYHGSRSSPTSVWQVCQALKHLYVPSCDASIAESVDKLSGMFPDGVQVVMTVIGRIFVEVPRVGQGVPGPETPVAGKASSGCDYVQPGFSFFSWLWRKSNGISGRSTKTARVYGSAKQRKPMRGLRALLLPLLVQIAAARPRFPSIVAARSAWDQALAALPPVLRQNAAPDPVAAGRWVQSEYSLVDAQRSACAVLEQFLRQHSMAKLLLASGVVEVIGSCLASSFADLQDAGTRLACYFLSPSDRMPGLPWIDLTSSSFGSAYSDDEILLESEEWQQKPFPTKFCALQLAPFYMDDFKGGLVDTSELWTCSCSLSPPVSAIKQLVSCESAEELRSLAFYLAGRAGVGKSMVAWISEVVYPVSPSRYYAEGLRADGEVEIDNGATDDLSSVSELRTMDNSSARRSQIDGEGPFISNATFVHSIVGQKRVIRRSAVSSHHLDQMVFISAAMLADREFRATSLRSGLPEALCAIVQLLGSSASHLVLSPRQGMRRQRTASALDGDFGEEEGGPEAGARGTRSRCSSNEIDSCVAGSGAGSDRASDASYSDSGSSDATDSNSVNATRSRRKELLVRLLLGGISSSCYFYGSYSEAGAADQVSPEQSATIAAQAGVVLNGGVARLISAIELYRRAGSFTMVLLRALACLARHKPFADVIGDYGGVPVLCRLVEHARYSEKAIMWAAAEVFACIACASLPSRRLLLTKRALNCTLKIMRSNRSESADVIQTALRALSQLAMIPCESCSSSCQIMDWMMGDDDATREAQGRLQSIWVYPLPSAAAGIGDAPQLDRTSSTASSKEKGSDSHQDGEARRRRGSLELRDALKLEVDAALDLARLSEAGPGSRNPAASISMVQGDQPSGLEGATGFEPIYDDHLGLICAMPAERGVPYVPVHPLRFWKVETSGVGAAVRQRRFDCPDICLKCGKGTADCIESILGTFSTMASAAAKMNAFDSVKEWEASMQGPARYSGGPSSGAGSPSVAEQSAAELPPVLSKLFAGVGKAPKWDSLAQKLADAECASARSDAEHGEKSRGPRRMSSTTRIGTMQSKSAIEEAGFWFNRKEASRYGIAPLAALALYWPYLGHNSMLSAIQLLTSFSVTRKARNYIAAGPIMYALRLCSRSGTTDVREVVSRLANRVGLPNGYEYVMRATRGNLNAVKCWLQCATSLARQRRFCTKLARRTRRAWEDRRTSRRLRWSRLARVRKMLKVPKRYEVAASLQQTRLPASRLASAGLYASVYDAITSQSSGAGYTSGTSASFIASTWKLHVSSGLTRFFSQGASASHARAPSSADHAEELATRYDRITSGSAAAASAASHVLQSHHPHARRSRGISLLEKLQQASSSTASSYRAALVSVAATGAEASLDGTGSAEALSRHSGRLGQAIGSRAWRHASHESGGDLLIRDALDETSSEEEWADACEAWWEAEGRLLYQEEQARLTGLHEGGVDHDSPSTSDTSSGSSDVDTSGGSDDSVAKVPASDAIAHASAEYDGWTMVSKQRLLRADKRMFSPSDAYAAPDLNHDLFEIAPSLVSVQQGYQTDDDRELHAEWGLDDRRRLNEEYGSYLISRYYYGPFVPCPATESLQSSPDVIEYLATSASHILSRIRQDDQESSAKLRDDSKSSVAIRARAILMSSIFGIERDERVLHRVVRLDSVDHLALLQDLAVHSLGADPDGYNLSPARSRAKSSYGPRHSETMSAASGSSSIATHSTGADDQASRSRGGSSPVQRKRARVMSCEATLEDTDAEHHLDSRAGSGLVHSVLERMLVLCPHGYERMLYFCADEEYPDKVNVGTLGELTMQVYERSSRLKSTQEVYSLIQLARCLAGQPLGQRTDWHLALRSSILEGAAAHQVKDSVWKCAPLITSICLYGGRNHSPRSRMDRYPSILSKGESGSKVSGTDRQPPVLMDLPPSIRWLVLDSTRPEAAQAALEVSVPLSWSSAFQYSLAMHVPALRSRVVQHHSTLNCALPYPVFLLRGIVGLSCRYQSLDAKWCKRLSALIVRRKKYFSVAVQDGFMHASGAVHRATSSAGDSLREARGSFASSSVSHRRSYSGAAFRSRTEPSDGTASDLRTDYGKKLMKVDDFLVRFRSTTAVDTASALSESAAVASSAEGHRDSEHTDAAKYFPRHSYASRLSAASSRKQSDPMVLAHPGRAADIAALAELPKLVLPPVPGVRKSHYLLSDLSACELGCKDPFDLLQGAWLVPLKTMYQMNALSGSWDRMRPGLAHVDVSYSYGLRHLDLTRCLLGDELSATVLQACCSSETLLSIDLSVNEIGPLAPQTLGALIGADGLLRRSSTLRALHLTDNSLSDEFCARLFAALSNYRGAMSNPLLQACRHVTVAGKRLHESVLQASRVDKERNHGGRASPSRVSPVSSVRARVEPTRDTAREAYGPESLLNIRDGLVRSMSTTAFSASNRAKRAKLRGSARYPSPDAFGMRESPERAQRSPSWSGTNELLDLKDSHSPSYTLALAARWYQMNVSTCAPEPTYSSRVKLSPISAPLTVLDLRENRIGKVATVARGRTPTNLNGRLTPAEQALVRLLSKNQVLRELYLQGNCLSSEAGVRLCQAVERKNTTLWFCRLAGNPSVSMRDRRRVANCLRVNRSRWMQAALGICVQRTIPRGTGSTSAGGSNSNLKESAAPRDRQVSPIGSDAAASSENAHDLLDSPENRYSTNVEETAGTAARNVSRQSSPAEAGEVWESNALEGFSSSDATTVQPIGSWQHVDTEVPQTGVAAVPGRKSRTQSLDSPPSSIRFDSPRLVSVVFAMPLRAYGSKGAKTQVRIRRWDVEDERKQIHAACRTSASNQKIMTYFCFGHQNVLEQVIAQGCRVLVLSGHSNGACMYLEGPCGGAIAYDLGYLERELQEIKAHNSGRIKIDMVIISMCQSARIGKIFEAAGIPHVVCINQDFRVRSQSAVRFTASIISLLAQQKTVAEAFQKAVHNVEKDPLLGVQEGKRYAASFLLLPDGGASATGHLVAQGWGSRVRSDRPFDANSDSDDDAAAASGAGKQLGCSDVPAPMPRQHDRKLFGSCRAGLVDSLAINAQQRRKQLERGVKPSDAYYIAGWLTGQLGAPTLTQELLPYEHQAGSTAYSRDAPLEQDVSAPAYIVKILARALGSRSSAEESVPVPAGTLEDGGSSFRPLLQGIPKPKSHIVGRELEVRSVLELVSKTKFGLVTLHGHKQIGKSTLAVLVSYYVAERGGCGLFDDGVYFINFLSSNRTSIVDTLLEALVGRRLAHGLRAHEAPYHASSRGVEFSKLQAASGRPAPIRTDRSAGEPYRTTLYVANRTDHADKPMHGALARIKAQDTSRRSRAWTDTEVGSAASPLELDRVDGTGRRYSHFPSSAVPPDRVHFGRSASARPGEEPVEELDRMQLVVDLLKDRHCMIVLDNCDARDDQELLNVVKQIMQAATGVLLLATRRSPFVPSLSDNLLTPQADEASKGAQSQHVGATAAVSSASGPGMSRVSSTQWWPDEKTYRVDAMPMHDLRRLAERVLGRVGLAALNGEGGLQLLPGPGSDDARTDTLDRMVKSSGGNPQKLMQDAEQIKKACSTVQVELDEHLTPKDRGQASSMSGTSGAGANTWLEQERLQVHAAAAAVGARSQAPRATNPAMPQDSTTSEAPFGEIGDGTGIAEGSHQHHQGIPWTQLQPVSDGESSPGQGGRGYGL